MLIQRFAAVALGIMMGTSLLLQTGTVMAAKSEAYYTTQKISDYKKGEFAVVVGPSGAGKTTVLNILGEWIRQQVERSGSMERIL